MVKQFSVTLIHHYKIVFEFIQTEDIFSCLFFNVFIFVYKNVLGVTIVFFSY